MRKVAEMLTIIMLAVGGLAVATGTAYAEPIRGVSGCFSYSYDQAGMSATVYYHNRCAVTKSLYIYPKKGGQMHTETVHGGVKGSYRLWATLDHVSGES
jgi:hypothetical protein